MKKGKIPWSEESGIKCCIDCTPPKRHTGCYDSCKEYQEQKAQFEKRKKIKSNPPIITAFDFDKISYGKCGQGRRKRRYK